MLVLTRRIGEILRIDSSISITILRIEGNQVRIGLDAPREVRIYREEIYCKLDKSSERKVDSIENKLLP